MWLWLLFDKRLETLGYFKSKHLVTLNLGDFNQPLKCALISYHAYTYIHFWVDIFMYAWCVCIVLIVQRISFSVLIKFLNSNTRQHNTASRNNGSIVRVENCNTYSRCFVQTISQQKEEDLF